MLKAPVCQQQFSALQAVYEFPDDVQCLRKRGQILVQVAVPVDPDRLYGTQANCQVVTGVPPFTDTKESLLINKICEIARRSCR